MTDIPLATVDAAGRPSGAMLRRRLADLALPARTAALLGDSCRPKSGVRPSTGSGHGELVEPRSPLSTPDTGHRTPDDSIAAAASAEIFAALHALVGHLASGDADAACYERAVARLVGLGPGLTPTGDDLLVALAATSRLLSGADNGGNGHGVLISRAAADALAGAVATLPPIVTTEVAHHLLRESAAGRFPEPLAAFLRALGDRRVDRETLVRLADRLISTGAHSGADWLAGVVALARACTRENTF